MPAAVSVIIPAFGHGRDHTAVRVAVEGWRAQEIDCEIVVAADARAAAGLADLSGAMVVTVDGEIDSPGVLRNAAVAAASGEWLYCSDADVCPLGPDFLGRALDLVSDGCVAQPGMYRLTGAVTQVDPDSLQDGHVFHYVDGSGRARPVPGEQLVWDGGVRMVVPPPRLLNDGPEDLRWCAPFHWGAVLVRYADFAAVGGYCVDYVGWGCEDDDLLVKLAVHGTVTTAWRADPGLQCIHFEHPRPYATAFRVNQELLRSRMSAGARSMIDSDVAAFHPD